MTHRFLYVLCTLAFLHSGAALAVGNVLLPDSSTNTSKGSAVLPAPESSTQIPLTPDVPTATAVPADTSSDPRVQAAKKAADDLAAQVGENSPFMASVRAATKEMQMPTPTLHETSEGFVVKIPTTIMASPVTPSIPSNPDPNAPKPAHKLHIEFADKTWTAAMVDQIVNGLGIEAKKIPTLCSINANGIMTAGTSPQLFDTGGRMEADVSYDGTVTKVIATIQALCQMIPLGPEQGFVKQVGNKYAVDMGVTVCDAPTDRNFFPSKLNLTVGGPMNPVGTCDFK